MSPTPSANASPQANTPAVNCGSTSDERFVRVTDASGKPLAGTLTNNILLGGIPVGKVDNGKVWRFRGSWREPKGQEITWPAAGKGQTFGFQTVVRVSGRKVKKTFLVTVR